MFEREREAVALVRRRPGLLLAGTGVTIVLLVGVGATLATTAVIGIDEYVLLVGPLPGLALALLLLPFPLGGCYAVALTAVREEGRAGATAGSESGSEGRDGQWQFAPVVEAAGTNYHRLLAASVAACLVGLVVGGALVLVLLSAVTVADYAGYRSGSRSPPSAMRTARLLVTLAGIATVVVGPLLSFHDLPVLDERRTPTEGWAAAVQFALARPRRLLRFLLGKLLLFSPAVLVPVAGFRVLTSIDVTTWALLSDWLTATVLALVVVPSALAAITASTLAVAYRVVVYERAVVPALMSTSLPSASGLSARQTRALGVAGLVVVAAVGGGVAVRVEDTGPRSAGTTPVEPGEDAAAIVATARDRAQSHGHRRVVRYWRTNESTGEWDRQGREVLGVDHDDRRIRFARRAEAPDGLSRATEHYWSEGTIARANHYPDAPNPGFHGDFPDLLGSRAGNWSAFPYPGYILVADGRPWNLPLPSGDGDRWTVAQRTDGTVVLEWRNGTHPGADAQGTHLVEQRYELAVEEATGYPQRLVATAHYTRYDDDHVETARWRERTEVKFRAWETVDVERPDALGPRSPLEWLWDFAYY